MFKLSRRRHLGSSPSVIKLCVYRTRVATLLLSLSFPAQHPTVTNARDTKGLNEIKFHLRSSLLLRAIHSGGSTLQQRCFGGIHIAWFGLDCFSLHVGGFSEINVEPSCRDALWVSKPQSMKDPLVPLILTTATCTHSPVESLATSADFLALHRSAE